MSYSSKEGDHPPQLVLTRKQSLITTRTEFMPVCSVPSTTADLTDQALVKEAYGDRNFSQSGSFNLMAKYVYGSRIESLLKFAFGCAFNRSNVSRAVLKLHCKNGAPSGGKVFGVLGDWAGDSVTWNNAPDFRASFNTEIGAVTRGDWKEIDVTAVMNAMEGNEVTIRIIGSSEDFVTYASNDEGVYAPVLEVFF